MTKLERVLVVIALLVGCAEIGLISYAAMELNFGWPEVVSALLLTGVYGSLFGFWILLQRQSRRIWTRSSRRNELKIYRATYLPHTLVVQLSKRLRLRFLKYWPGGWS